MKRVNADNRTLGATLVEVIITTGVFSVLMLVLFSIVQYGMDSWRSIEGRSVTQTMMRKIGVFAMDDIRRGSFSQLGVGRYTNYSPSSVTATVGTAVSGSKAPVYGQALWMLSAYNDAAPGSGGNVYFPRSDDGKPSWSKNVLYYVSVINDDLHQQKYGGTIAALCGNENACPHKWLIRREISNGTLLTQEEIKKYIVQPDTSGKLFEIKDGVTKTQVLADCLVAFRVIADKPSVTLVIKSARLEELRRQQQVTGTSIGGRSSESEVATNAKALKNLDTMSDAASRLGSYTLQYDITVIPHNN